MARAAAELDHNPTGARTDTRDRAKATRDHQAVSLVNRDTPGATGDGRDATGHGIHVDRPVRIQRQGTCRDRIRIVRGPGNADVRNQCQGIDVRVIRRNRATDRDVFRVGGVTDHECGSIAHRVDLVVVQVQLIVCGIAAGARLFEQDVYQIRGRVEEHVAGAGGID